MSSWRMPPGYNRLVTPLLTGLAHVALTSSSLRTPLCAVSTLSLLPVHPALTSTSIPLVGTNYICIAFLRTLVGGRDLFRIFRHSIQLHHCDSAYSTVAKKKRPSGPSTGPKGRHCPSMNSVLKPWTPSSK